MSYKATRFPRVTSADSWGGKEKEKELDSLAQVVVEVKNLPANAWYVGDEGSIPGLGRSPGGEHGNPLHSHVLT